MMRHVRRSAVIAAGASVAALGLILMPVPGPGGTPVFLAGLAILATEVRWAKKFLSKFKGAYAGMSKGRRLALAYSMLAFYAVSGAVAWNWMNRTQDATAENARG